MLLPADSVVAEFVPAAEIKELLSKTQLITRRYQIDSYDKC